MLRPTASQPVAYNGATPAGTGGPMREPSDIDELFRGMAEYAEDSDRTDPRRFVGRKHEMQRLVLALERTAADNPRSATRVVHGIPGMGKTALSKEFQRRINGASMAGKTAWAVEVDCADFDLPPLKLVQKVAAKLPARMDLIPGGGEWARRTRTAVRKAAETALLFGTGKTGREAMQRVTGLDDAADLATCINAFAGSVWPEEIVVALVADEFQACPVTDRVRAALRVIDSCEHESRMQLVLFGLPNVTSLLRDDLGLSRMTENAEIPLGPLMGSEGRQVVAETLEALGLAVSNPAWSYYLRELDVAVNDWTRWKDALADRIAEDSLNFPQHLTSGLLATVRALIDTRGKLACGARLQADIAERFERIKSGYYARRLGPLEEHSMALGALSCMEDGAAPEGIAIDLLIAGADGREVPLSRRQALDVLRSAVGRSVIDAHGEQGGVVYVASSIPSMRHWLTAAFKQGVQEGWPAARAIVERHGQRLPEQRVAP